jgi:hypothetical protein
MVGRDLAKQGDLFGSQLSENKVETVSDLFLFSVDPVVIINNTIASATLAYLTICCNYNGVNFFSLGACKGIIDQIITIARGTIYYATEIARVTIDLTLGLARSHYTEIGLGAAD